MYLVLFLLQVVSTTAQCATSDEDYTAITTVEYIFTAGEATLTIPVSITNDILVEEKEQFMVSFTIKDKTVNDIRGEVDKAIVVIFSEDIGKHFQLLKHLEVSKHFKISPKYFQNILDGKCLKTLQRFTFTSYHILLGLHRILFQGD